MKAIKTLEWITGILWILAAIAYLWAVILFIKEIVIGAIAINAYSVLVLLLMLAIIFTWILLSKESKLAKRMRNQKAVGFGEHDWDKLSNEWNENELEGWGLDIEKQIEIEGERFIYYLMDENSTVLYVGTAKNVKSRFKSHLKRTQTDNSLFYRYCRKNNIKLKCKIIQKVIGTYEFAESIEIKHIVKNKDTVLNFYNNPNKENLKRIEKELVST